MNNLPQNQPLASAGHQSAAALATLPSKTTRAAIVIVRSLLGLLFVVFGANGFFHFIPMPPPKGLAGDFMKALSMSHYFDVIAFLQITGGALLLAGRFVPLGLTLLGPVIVNILLFHVFLDPAGLPMAVFVAGLALVLLWHHRAHFAGLLSR